MIDEFAKKGTCTASDLREIREVMLWKLDGLSEYDIRRPSPRPPGTPDTPTSCAKIERAAKAADPTMT